MRDPFDPAGTLRDVYRNVDWSQTPLGPAETWSPALRGALEIVLHSRFPVTLMWGPEHVLVYNDAYIQMIGDKHPEALGMPSRKAFPEIWDQIGPMLDRVSAGCGTEWVENLRLLMNRHGYVEETYFTFSYSPVSGPDGVIEGVIDIASETTSQLLGHRRLELLSRLNDRLSDLEHPQQLVDRALPILRGNPEDLPGAELIMAPATDGRDFVVEQTPDGLRAAMRLAGVSDAEHDATFVTRLSPHLAPDETYLGFVRLVGTALSQALSRARQREAERRVALMEHQMSETLQHSLLTPPPRAEGLQIAVRYRSAVEQAQVGGDWYDSFRLPDGRLTMVVGDVTGHDREAAAAMAQLRNLLRGVSYTLRHFPSRVLAGVDDAAQGLGVGALATVILAHVDHEGPRGQRVVEWSNAGHPPPVLLAPDGRVTMLHTRPELLLGVRANAPRTDHTTTLEPGASMIFYTDGLVERRGQALDAGLQDLTETLDGLHGLSADELCDHLLDQFGPSSEDDVVLAVVRSG